MYAILSILLKFILYVVRVFANVFDQSVCWLAAMLMICINRLWQHINSIQPCLLYLNIFMKKIKCGRY